MDFLKHRLCGTASKAVGRTGNEKASHEHLVKRDEINLISVYQIAIS